MNSGKWNQDEVRILRKRYPHERTEDIARDLGRKVGGVYQKAYNLGLYKSEKYLASPAACRTNGKQGMGTRFQKGHESWNKGKRFVAGGRSAETQFKPGEMPHNHVPIGTERVTKDGIRQRKVRDTGYPPRDWKSCHALLWVEHHGEIPKGRIVVFKDGNRDNLVIDNLECITRSENMRRNTLHRCPKDVALAIQLRGALTRQINKRERANEKHD